MTAQEPPDADHAERPPDSRALRAATLGRVAAVTVTLLGTVYAVGLVAVALSSGGVALRPSPALQWWAALGTLATCPPIVVVFYSLNSLRTPAGRRATRLSFTLASLFGLTIVVSRLVFLSTSARGISGAALLTVEFVGWGFFLSMAILAAGWALRHDADATHVRHVGFAYAAIALVGLSAHALHSSASVVGFLAWGFVLYLWTWRLSRWFKRECLRNGGSR